MQYVTDYTLYEGQLVVTVSTQRPEAQPSGILAAATLHEEYAARARSLLREYKQALAPYLPFYRILKLQPAGGVREIENNFDIMRLQFALSFTMIDAAQTGDETQVFAIERNLEKAVRDLFAANQLPDLFIPGDTENRGDSYIDIVFTPAGASEPGVWLVP